MRTGGDGGLEIVSLKIDVSIVHPVRHAEMICYKRPCNWCPLIVSLTPP